MIRDYYSAPVLLKIAQKEYEIEDDRAKRTDSRSGIFISLSSALILFMAKGILNPSISFKQSMHIYILKGYLYHLYNLLNGLAFIFLGASIFYFIKAISVTAYKRFDIDEFSTFTKCSETIFSQTMLEYYTEIINKNRKSNDKKIQKVKVGINLLRNAIILIIIAQIYLYIIKF